MSETSYCEELGVLMNRGYAPDLKTGIVKKISEIGEENIPADWLKIREKVLASGKLDEFDGDAYNKFLNETQETDRTLKTTKKEGTNEIEAMQTNTFLGNPNIPKAP